MNNRQLSLFEEVEITDNIQQIPVKNSSPIFNGRELGTFKDSLRAPIHRWFRYPAGYSYKFVEAVLDAFVIKPRDWVYDPFSGSGTTLITAKQKGINAYGVEAHEFVHWVASVKLYWDYDLKALSERTEQLLRLARSYVFRQENLVNFQNVFPDLIYKCYHSQDLRELYLLREFCTQKVEIEIRDLFKLALTDTLRGSAAAGTGWPYIAPNKNTGDKPPKKAYSVFEDTLRKMVSDLWIVFRDIKKCEILNVLGDSRERQNLENNQVDIAITSPPYLNNFDYADRTRLETYFWGITTSWGEITEKYRNKLITAATTQVNRSLFPDLKNVLSKEIKYISPHAYTELQNAISKLADLRLTKGGKKDYDLMVALYFNDIFKVLVETYRVLKPGGYFCLVLGDSAPYGVHIQTDRIIGELGKGIGFENYSLHELRTRGDKWKENPQRHKVGLRETVVVLKK